VRLCRHTLLPAIAAVALGAAAHAQTTTPVEVGRISMAPAAAAPMAARPAPAAPAAAPKAARSDPYDFSLIVQTLQGSVRPLAQELDESFGRFTGEIERAVALMDEGRTEAAVEVSVDAIGEVLSARDRVLTPMWEAQTFLAARIGEVRGRLAAAVEGSTPASASEPDRQVEVLLDGIARRIAQTSDPIRKQRLVAHYRTIRDLASVQRNARRLTPDERNLWAGALSVLEQAALAHQRVLMGSEVLFSQLDATALRMGDYLELLRTVQGVNELIAGVSGMQDGLGGMEGFVEAMRGLSDTLVGFDEAITSALEGSMGSLQERIDTLSPEEGVGTFGMPAVSIDTELAGRLQRVAGN